MIAAISRTLFTFASIALVSYPVTGRCGLGERPDAPSFEVLEAVDNGTLEEMRGGYDSPEGLHFDIGVGKAIYIGGILQLQNSMEANNISFNGAALSAGNLQNLSSEVQSIIQNNLDNRIIQNFTVMDVNVRNFGGFMEAMKNLQDIGSIQAVQVLR